MTEISDAEIESKAIDLWSLDATGYYDPEFSELNSRKKNQLRKEAREILEYTKANS